MTSFSSKIPKINDFQDEKEFLRMRDLNLEGRDVRLWGQISYLVRSEYPWCCTPFPLLYHPRHRIKHLAHRDSSG